MFTMKFIKKFLKYDDPIMWLYMNFFLVLIAQLSFILSYYIRFPHFIQEYNYRPFLKLIPFYTLFIIFFSNFFNLFNIKSYKELIVQSIKAVLLITMSSMAVAYIFRTSMQGIPSSIFIISTAINSIAFIEILKHRKSK